MNTIAGYGLEGRSAWLARPYPACRAEAPSRAAWTAR
jgi:hypothetical protein